MLCGRYRLRRRVAAAQRRLAGRVRRTADDRRVPRESQRSASQRLPDSVVRARHESGVRADGGHAGRRRRVRSRRQRRSCRSRGEGRRALRGSRGDHGHVSVDTRRVRAGHRPHLRDRPCPRRPGVCRRREPERAGRPCGTGPIRRRRVAPEPAQDVLHSARRRRPRRRSGRVQVAPRAVPAGTPVWCAARSDRREQDDRPGLGRAVRLGIDPADLVDVHHDDGC